MSGFWDKLLAGSSPNNSVSMDSHISGRTIGSSFEGVRNLTDRIRERNALPLPVEAGTKVSFVGNVGSYLSYEDVPPEGSIGEVVKVRSSMGDITHNDGRVFIQWDDGKFRSIQAEHLKRVSAPKKAAQFDAELGIFNSQYPYHRDLEFIADRRRVVIGPGQFEIPSTRALVLSKAGLVEIVEGTFGKELKLTGKGRKSLDESREEFGKLASGKIPWVYMSEGDRKKSAKYWTEEKQKAILWEDEERLKEVENKAMRDGLLWKGDKYVPDTFDPARHEMQRRAFPVKVSSLGDLTQFLKRADGKLIHKSTRDLWSYSKDAEGNFLINRLFDDDGEPLKG